MRTYQDMFRPAYEAPACVAWAGSAVVLAATTPPMWSFMALGALALAYRRGKQTYDLYRFRASVSVLRVETMTPDAVVEQSTKLLAGDDKYFWLGRGYRWRQRHAEISRQLMQVNDDEIPTLPAWMPASIKRSISPDNMVPLKDSAIGVPWIHGIEPEEVDLKLPVEALPGHTLIVGTTRAGKTRLYELLSTQIVHAGKVLIVIDPKGDKDWEKRLRRECAKAKRRFLYFHPAHPSSSIRINPLANWNSLSEPATRIGQLIDADGTFAAFAWKTLYRIMRGIVADGGRPTIKAAKEYVQLGVEPLLMRLLTKALFAKEGAKWDANLQQYVDRLGGKKAGAAPGRLDLMIAKYQDLQMEDEAIASLISMVHHSKEHYSKMIQVLEPILEMLGSDEVGKMLSPDPTDLSDTRPIWDTQKIIDDDAVLYVGLDSLSNKIIGSAIGSILLADIASVLGAIYNFREKKDIYLFIDEAAEVVNEQTIQILNKGGGAGMKAFIATQTIADFDAVFGSNARTKQALGNLNNVICLRVKDPDMAKWIADSFGTTNGRSLNVSYSSGSDSSSSVTEFRGQTTRSMVEKDIPFVHPDLLTRLPGLQYFAFLAGSTIYKGRLPLISD